LKESQVFLAVKPVDAADPRRLAFPPQQDEQPPVAETMPLLGKTARPFTQGAIVGLEGNSAQATS